MESWILDIIKIIAGLTALYYGGELLVTASVRIARSLKLSSFVIGATVIGFGTSSPELSVSILAALEGAPELAMGNVIGSNIANIGLVLGVTALVAPLTIRRSLFLIESPPLMIASLLVLFLAWDHSLQRWEGMFMVFLLACHLFISLRNAKGDEIEIEDEEEVSLFAGKTLPWQAALALAGLSMLVVGAHYLVEGGVSIARSFGISEWFIGISIIAVGTSLPEISSSLIAAKRGHGEMAIGNIFGSNIFNILMVLGATATIAPLNIKENIHADMLYSTGITTLLLLFLYRQMNLSKFEGGVLLSTYFFYIIAKGTGLF
jgi:cation:H+ antiporter